MSDEIAENTVEVESKKYPANVKGGKRPWPNPWNHEKKVGEGVVNKTVTLEERHIDWLRGQPNQSEYLRALLDADIMKRSLPEHYSKGLENVHNAVLSALLMSLTKEIMLDQASSQKNEAVLVVPAIEDVG